jgi:prepilin-type processing-associated H-X9-DG protein
MTFACSRITLKKVTDGTSKTIFVGEKSLQPRFYFGDSNTSGPTDNGALYEGHDWDVLRWGGRDDQIGGGFAANNNVSLAQAAASPGNFLTPLQDKNALNSDGTPDDAWGERSFGSAHSGGCMFVLCDGSVQMLGYSIDPKIFWQLCNRRDGLDVQVP